MIRALTVMLTTKMVDAAPYDRSEIGADRGGESSQAVIEVFHSGLSG